MSDKARSALTYDGMEHASADYEQHTRLEVPGAYVKHIPGKILVREERAEPHKIEGIKNKFKLYYLALDCCFCFFKLSSSLCAETGKNETNAQLGFVFDDTPIWSPISFEGLYRHYGSFSFNSFLLTRVWCL